MNEQEKEISNEEANDEPLVFPAESEPPHDQPRNNKSSKNPKKNLVRRGQLAPVFIERCRPWVRRQFM